MPVTTHRRIALPAWRRAALLLWAAVLAGCSTPIETANQLARAGRYDEALTLLQQAAKQNPGDEQVRLRLLRERNARAQQLLLQAEGARAGGRLAEAKRLVDAAEALDGVHPRVTSLRAELDRTAARNQRLDTARQAFKARRFDAAAAIAGEVLAEEPGHPGAALLRQQIAAEQRPRSALVLAMNEAFRKPISLEFRDAPLRSVFESLSRGSGLNFVFDREVRADSKLTLMLRDTTLDEALRIVLGTQGLERKLLNDSTLLIFPNTPSKLREHQDLSTRAFYLSNADVKQVQAMVRTLAKARDVHIDERLNLMLVRDTPEVLLLIEKLVATVDLPEPEVMLEVQVMEVASDKLDSYGLQWPETASFGLPNLGDVAGAISPPALAAIGARGQFRGWTSNPAFVALLKGNTGSAQLIANPTIRVRNREKAKIHVGDKLPVFTTTATANVGVSASVSYLDVGLKLEIEPTVQLGNDVSMRVSLEVSNLIKEVSGPSSALAYQVGTRVASTVLRLSDGETQVLAGLINDEDRRRAIGVPGLSTMPVLGALFGVQSDNRSKTEVVLLITPRVVRNVAMPSYDGLLFDSGSDANPGALPLRLSAAGRSSSGMTGGGPAAPAAGPTAAAPAPLEGGLVMSASETGRIGETVSVTLRNESPYTARGEMQYDPNFLQIASNDLAEAGAVRFELAPRTDKVVVFRVLPTARGQSLSVTLGTVQARRPDGGNVMLPASGGVLIDVVAE